MQEKRERSMRTVFQGEKFHSAMTVLLPTIFGILLFLLWQTQVLHVLLHTDTFTLPLPSRIASIIYNNLPVIMENVKATLIVSLSGLFFGSVLGYLLAMFVAAFPTIGRGGLAVVSVFNAIPIVALAPVMNNWTKDVSTDAETRSLVAKILVVTIVCMANMSVNAYRGFVEVKPFSEDFLRTLAVSKRQEFWKLKMPNSVPYVFTALKVALPSSIIATIVSEYFAEYLIGIGRQIKENILMAQYATAWSYITVACIFGIVLYALLLIIQSRVMKLRGM